MYLPGLGYVQNGYKSYLLVFEMGNEYFGLGSWAV